MLAAVLGPYRRTILALLRRRISDPFRRCRLSPLVEQLKKVQARER